MIERGELHKLLDMMLDEGKNVGDYHFETTDAGVIRVKHVRIILNENDYTLYGPTSPQGT